jgi:hypothetical protein
MSIVRFISASVRVVFGLAALAVVLFGAIVGIAIFRGYYYAPEPKACTYMMSMDVVLNGRSLSIPAKKDIMLQFPFSKDDPLGLRIVHTDFNAYGEPTRGFCVEEVAGRSEIGYIQFGRGPFLDIAERLNLFWHASFHTLYFGRSNLDFWVNPNPVTEGAVNPAHYRLTKPFDDDQYRQHMETFGWLEGKYRIASSCIEIPPNVSDMTKSCFVWVKKKSDGIIYLVSSIQIPDWPQENQRPPAAFVEFARNIPAIVDMFEKP